MEVKELHYCEGTLPSKPYGPALDVCYEEGMHFWVENGEYSSQVNYCPYCGMRAPFTAIDDFKRNLKADKGTRWYFKKDTVVNIRTDNTEEKDGDKPSDS